MLKVLRFLRNVIELYIPVLSFFAMFVAFLLQVFSRYVVGQPLTWTQEVITMAFIWTVVLGACHTMRVRGHVKFTMVYDRFAPKPAAVLRILGNLIIFVAFVILIVPSYKYSFFLGFQKTAVFRISFTFMFLTFVYFLVSVACYTALDIIEDINVIRGALPDSAEHATAAAEVKA